MASPLVPPILMLWITIVVTLAAFVVSKVARRRDADKLSGLARQWGMQYSPRDVFHLAPRVAAHLPIIAASDVRIRDLIYGTDPGGGHRCVFSAEYTAGVVRSKSRHRCVVCIVELPHQAPAEPVPGALPEVGQSAMRSPSSLLQIAASDLPLLEQYESLRTVSVR